MAEHLDWRGKPRVQTIRPDDEEPVTIQSDAHLADIENIMNKFKTGGMQMLDETQLMFADVSEFTDLADALNQAKVAEVQFMKLPSKVREIFDHDVAVWLDSAHDEEKRDALVEAGFIKRDKVAETGSEGGDPGAVAGSVGTVETGETKEQSGTE